jgi:hypothetical protein
MVRRIAALPAPTESLGMKKAERNGSSGGGWVYNDSVQKAKTEIPAYYRPVDILA